jgi:DNA-binding Xre family transcriptional regulator
MIDRDVKLTDIGLSSATRAKINKNEYVSMEVLDRICSFFNCQPGDILEHIPNNENKKLPG